MMDIDSLSISAFVGSYKCNVIRCDSHNLSASLNKSLYKGETKMTVIFNYKNTRCEYDVHIYRTYLTTKKIELYADIECCQFVQDHPNLFKKGLVSCDSDFLGLLVEEDKKTLSRPCKTKESFSSNSKKNDGYVDWSIPRVYNRYRFKSSLEARWAVFFDVLGVRYLYEEKTFKIEPHCGDKKGYQPDFYFPEFGIYGEVKQTNQRLKEDAGKMADTMEQTSCSKIMILGPLPKTNYAAIPTYDFVHVVEPREFLGFIAVAPGVFYANKQGKGSLYVHNRDFGVQEGKGLPPETSVDCKYYDPSQIADFDILKTMKAFDTAIHYKFEE